MVATSAATTATAPAIDIIATGPPWKYLRRRRGLGARTRGGAGTGAVGCSPREPMADEGIGGGKRGVGQGVRTGAMFAVLLLLFVIVPIVELAVIIQVGHVLGVLPTIVTLLAISFGGAWLVKREGLGVWRRFRQQMESGHVPGRELADGV